MIKRRLIQTILRPISNQSGVAAILMVVFSILILATVGLTFVVETQQKQASSAITGTSAQALILAEAGLRYTEKCLDSTNLDCLCNVAPMDCTDWTTLTNLANTNLGAGSFTVDFTNQMADSVRATSTGFAGGAERSLSRNFTRTPACLFENNSLSFCEEGGGGGIHPGADTGGADVDIDCDTSTGIPDIPEVGPTFNPDPTGCPNADYPDYNAGIHLTGNNLNTLRFCSMAINENVIVPDDGTLWVANNFSIANSDDLQTGGDAAINVAGNFDMANSSTITLSGGTLTLHVDGDVMMDNGATINDTGNIDDSENVMMLVVGDMTMLTNSELFGGLIVEGGLTINNGASVKGAVAAGRVTMRNGSEIVYDSDAGSNAGGYGFCGGVATSVTPDWREG